MILFLASPAPQRKENKAECKQNIAMQICGGISRVLTVHTLNKSLIFVKTNLKRQIILLKIPFYWCPNTIRNCCFRKFPEIVFVDAADHAYARRIHTYDYVQAANRINHIHTSAAGGSRWRKNGKDHAFVLVFWNVFSGNRNRSRFSVNFMANAINLLRLVWTLDVFMIIARKGKQHRPTVWNGNTFVTTLNKWNWRGARVCESHAACLALSSTMVAGRVVDVTPLDIPSSELCANFMFSCRKQCDALCFAFIFISKFAEIGQLITYQSERRVRCVIYVWDFRRSHHCLLRLSDLCPYRGDSISQEYN